MFIALGDTICEYDINAVLSSSSSMLGVKKVDDPRNFGVAEIDDKGFINKVVEKPSIPKSNMALVGFIKLKIQKFCLNALIKLLPIILKAMMSLILLMRWNA